MRTVGVSDQIKKAFQEIDGLDTRIGGLDRDLRTAVEIRERLATLEARRSP